MLRNLMISSHQGLNQMAYNFLDVQSIPKAPTGNTWLDLDHFASHKCTNQIVQDDCRRLRALQSSKHL